MSMKFYKHVCKLGNTIRFPNIKLDRPYAGAEHSYRVAMLSMLIVDEYNMNPANTVKIDKAEVLSKALIHDLEESVLGDLPTPVKAHPGFRDMIREVSVKIMEEEIVDKDLPNRAEYIRHWVEDKEGASGEIISLTDKLEALMTAAYELKRGNKDIQKAFYNIRGWFESDTAKAMLVKFPIAQKFLETADEVQPLAKDSFKLVG